MKHENNLQEKLIIQVKNIFLPCLKDAVVDEIYNLIEPGKSCGNLASFLRLLPVVEKKCTRRIII